MPTAIETQGFKIEVKTASGPPAVWTEILGVTSFQGFDGQAAEIDVTTLRSTAKEYLLGLRDFGNFSIDTNFLSADPGQDALRAAQATRAVKDFRTTFSDGSTALFQGYVTSSPVSGGVDSKVEGSFAIRVTGDVTFTDAP